MYRSGVSILPGLSKSPFSRAGMPCMQPLLQQIYLEYKYARIFTSFRDTVLMTSVRVEAV
jgi:hypothetical protein